MVILFPCFPEVENHRLTGARIFVVIYYHYQMKKIYAFVLNNHHAFAAHYLSARQDFLCVGCSKRIEQNVHTKITDRCEHWY